MRRTKTSGRAEQYQSEEFVELQQRIAANARRLRGLRDWTQERAAQNCEMLPQHYFRVEKGVLNVTLTTLARLCKGYSVDAAEFFLQAPARAQVKPASSRSEANPVKTPAKATRSKTRPVVADGK